MLCGAILSQPQKDEKSHIQNHFVDLLEMIFLEEDRT